MPFTSWGADPRTWTNTEFVDKAMLDGHIRDKFKFLKDPPFCRATNLSPQNIASGVWQALAFPNEDFDNAGLHSTATNNERITIPTGLPGMWQFWGSFRYTDVSGGTTYARIRAVRSGGYHVICEFGPLGTYARFNLAGETYVEPGDYAVFETFQDKGSAATVVAKGVDDPMYFGARMVGGTVTT